YALVTLLGLLLMVWAVARARSGEAATDWIYVPAPWTRPVTTLLVALGFVSLAAAFVKGHLRQLLQNPMSIGVALWALGHLIANGKRVDVYVFATFLLVALTDIVISMRRGKRPAGPASLIWDGAAVAGGLVLFAIFLFGFHPYVLKLPVTN
ncbi:MAG: NnrU family protein, partial [Rhizobiales bacterium]|nr:NnrU family protein [Hyphomicrobiales bacterium]